MKKEFIFVCISLFLLVFGANISGTLLVPYAKALGGTSLTVGVVYGCMFIVRLVIGTPIGRISQKKGAKTILIYSLMLYPFISAAYLISWNIPSLIAARLLHGVASAMMLPMAMAYIGEISPEGQEGRFMGVYNMILFIASAFGPFVGGQIYDRYGIRYAFLTLLALAVCSLVIILVFAGNDKYKVNEKATLSGAETKKDETVFRLKGLRRNSKLMALSGMNIVTSVLLALLGASFTQLALSYGLNMGQIGFLIALNNTVIGITQVPFGYFIDRFNKSRLVIASGLAAALLILLLPSVKSIWGLAALISILGTFTALNLAAVTALSAILGKEIGMGNTMGFFGSVNSAGTIIGYLALGWIADTFGIQNSFYFAGIAFLTGIALFSIFWAKQKVLLL